MNPITKKIFDDLVKDVDGAVRRFQKKVRDGYTTWNPTSPQHNYAEPQYNYQEPDGYHGYQPAQPDQVYRPKMGQRLPWLSHGLLGFLRKLWYGNSPDNPTWKGFKTQESIAKIDKELDEELKFILREEYDEFGDMLKNFKTELIFIIKNHMENLDKIISVQATTPPQTTTQPAPTRKPSKKPFTQPTTGGAVSTRDDQPSLPFNEPETPAELARPQDKIIQKLVEKYEKEMSDKEDFYDKHGVEIEIPHHSLKGEKHKLVIPPSVEFKIDGKVVAAKQAVGYQSTPAIIALINALPPETIQEIKHHLDHHNLSATGTNESSIHKAIHNNFLSFSR